MSYEVKATIPPYYLPLSQNGITNYNDVVLKLHFTDKTDKLLENGFVVVPPSNAEDIIDPYQELSDLNIPIFVTADTFLHLHHIQFDEMLKEHGETIFYGDILSMTDILFKSASDLYGKSDGMREDYSQYVQLDITHGANC